MKNSIRFSILAIMLSAFIGFFFLGLTASNFIDLDWQKNFFTSPFVSDNAKEKPLQQYSLENLQKRQYVASPIKIEKVLEENKTYTSYLFSYTTTGKRVTGQINVPVLRAYSKNPKIILMLRGYLPAENYQTGMGTNSGANTFVAAGYVTVAPDFLGYGESDAESSDPWEARLVKPVNVIELIRSIQKADYLLGEDLELNDEQAVSMKQLNKASIGIWAHSNGGQIALSVLEILGEPIPTTLWAPMIAPFPYSILYFGWDEADEGKEQRKWISMFEEDYDVFDFSVTQHTDKLTGPLQIQHGSADNQVLTVWVESFVEKIKTNKPSPLGEEIESETLQGEDAIGEVKKVEVNYFEYPNADHNLQPVWNTAIQRDLKFFAENL